MSSDRLIRDEQRARTYRQYLIDVLLLIVCLMGVWALWSWRNANNAAGAASGRLNSILDKLDAKIDSVDTEKINSLIDGGSATLYAVKQRVDDLRYTQDQLNKSIAVLRDDSVEVKAFIAKLGGVADEAQAQMKQNGNATARLVTDTNASVNQKLLPEVTESMKATRVLMDKYGATADEASQAIKLVSKKSGKSIDEVNAAVVAAKDTINSTNATVIDFHKDLHDTMKEMPGIAKDIQKTTHNISKYSRISIITGIASNLLNSILPGLLH